MAESIVSTTLETLWGLLKEEAKLLSGVNDKVNEICREFRRMQCFLQDADARQYKDQSVRNSIREIRSLAYRAENVVETYIIEISSRRGRGWKKSCKRFFCILNELNALHTIASGIESIRSEIAEVTKSLQAYGIKEIDGGESSSRAANEKERWLRKTYAHEVEDSTFVGMKDDISKLMSLIMDKGGRDHPIVSIWGMGGSGKTTIARRIYNDGKIRRHFDAFAWVCISQQCQVRKNLEEILQHIFADAKRKEEVKSMADGELVEELYKQQKEKKCLVVLDDVWNRIDWDCLKRAFPTMESHSKILLTTRNKEVAEVGTIHKMNYLDEHEAWELLQKRALKFNNENFRDSSIEVEREKLGREMVRKCGNLPLAISILGGILSKYDSLDEWKMVNKDIDSYLTREGLQENKGIMQILSLSYDVLPYHLKPCFLYFGHFAEDLQVEAMYLYCCWIAEGMVGGQGEETLVEVAEQYLTELVSRSMVQVEVTEFPTTTTIRYDSCWLHGLMRELCLMKCIEEDFLKVVDFRDKSGEVKFWDPHPIIGSNDTYRLAIHTDRYVDGDAIVTQEISEQQLRSFISINLGQGENWSAEIAWSPQIFNKFKYLHVLDFQFYSFGDNKILEVIEELIHLRFLSFCNSNMDELPLGIFNLPFLQSLDLRLDYWNVPTQVPNQNVKWKAKRLRNIFFENTDARLVDQGKFRLHGLDQLERLSNFCSETMEVRDLCKLVTLQYFSATIFGNESLSLVLSCIEENWPRIRHVEIHINNCHFTSLQNENGASNVLRKVFMSRNLHGLPIEGGLGRGLPNLGSELAIKLHWLELIRSEMVEDPLEMLEKLPNLRKLRLVGAFVGKEMVCHAMGFPNLKHLVLQGLHNLEKLRVDEGAMCNLSRLHIEDCKRLVKIPDSLRFCRSLMELNIVGMPKRI